MAVPIVVSSIDATIRKLGKELSAAREKILVLDQQVLHRQRDIRQAVLEHQALLEKTKHQEDTISSMTLEIHVLRQKLLESHWDKDRIERTNRDLTAEIDRIKIERVQMGSHLDAMTQQLATERSESIKNNNYINALHKHISTMEATVAGSRLSEAALARTLGVLQATVNLHGQL
jgi:chromosome segregation ATPase